jgi:hypothetical protein
MAARGRVSAAARAVQPVYPHEPRGLEPPESLSEPARAVFVDLVASCDHAHFEPADLTLLCQYCEATALAEKAAFQLGGDTEPSAKWLSLWVQSTRTMSGLALRLRLGPQSRRERAISPRQLDWSTQFGLDQRR